MGKKLKKYNVIPDESTLTGLSVVEYPAVEQDFICFSKDEKRNDFVCLESEVSEKHRIVGVALRADFPVYRTYGDEEFYIEFSKECVEKMAHKFFRDGANYNMNTDHNQYTNGLYVCESWIVEDAENDKSNLYGLNAEVGSWVVMCQVTDIELWESFKNGERKGFSVEAWCNLEEIINKKETDMSKQKEQNMEVNESYWTKLSTILKEALGTQKEDTKLEEETEETTEEVPVEEIVEEVVETVEEETETTEEAAEDLQAIVDQLQEEVDALKAENEELKKANQKMSKKPSAKVNVKQSAEKSNPRDVIEKLYNGTYFNK